MRIIGVYVLLALLLVVAALSGAITIYDHFHPKTLAAADSTGTSASPTLKAQGPLQQEEQRKATVEATFNIRGVDLSHWDGPVNFATLKDEGITFVYMKATEGNTDVDPAFATNWAGANTSGLIRGAYHFFQPGIDPTQQANHFLATVNFQKNDLLPMLDVEVNGSLNAEEMTAAIKTWLEVVSKKLGKNPVVYTDGGFWSQYITGDFSQYPLWIAEWESSYQPKLPAGFSNWVMWQYSSTGTLNGIQGKGDVDLDCFNGSMTDLKKYMVR